MLADNFRKHLEEPVRPCVERPGPTVAVDDPRRLEESSCLRAPAGSDVLDGYRQDVPGRQLPHTFERSPFRIRDKRELEELPNRVKVRARGEPREPQECLQFRGKYEPSLIRPPEE